MAMERAHRVFNFVQRDVLPSNTEQWNIISATQEVGDRRTS